MKSLTQYLQTGSNVRIYEAADSLDELIKSGKPFIVTGDNFKKIKTPVFKAAQNNNCMFLTVYADKMTEDDLKPIDIGGVKYMPDWAANICDNDKENSVVAFVFDGDSDYSKILKAIEPIIVDKKLFNHKCSNMIPCIFSRGELELTDKLEKTLTKVNI